MATALPRLDPSRLRRHRLRNSLQTVLLVGGMALLAGLIAWLLFGAVGMVWAVAAVAAALAFGPASRPGRVMAVYGALPLTPADFPSGYAVIRDLARRSELPEPPVIYYLPSPGMNAFAAGGPDESAIAVTDGMLTRLSPREFSGVLAHEVSHIRNDDLRVMRLADTVGRFTSFLAFVGLFLLAVNLPLLPEGDAFIPWGAVLLLFAAPVFGSLLQLALARAREYDADLDAVHLTGDPVGLASALAKLERQQGADWENALGARRHRLSVLRSHPSTAARVRRLADLSPRQAPIDLRNGWENVLPKRPGDVRVRERR